jgi:hypothetical protein
MNIRNDTVRLLTAACLCAVSSVGHAQAVQTPYSTNEMGTSPRPAEDQASKGSAPKAGKERERPMQPAQGGTAAEELSGTIRGESLPRLPETPDSNSDVNRAGD